MADSLLSKVLPARNAAKRANANFAEQLESSDEETELARSGIQWRKSHGTPKPSSSKGSATTFRRRTKSEASASSRLKRPLSDDEGGSLLSLSSQDSDHRSSGLEPGETWRPENLDEYVWVLVDGAGNVYEPTQYSDNLFTWWPGRLEATRPDFRVKLYGDVEHRRVDIPHPLAEIILPFTTSLGRPRFDRPTHYTANSAESPRKRQRTNIIDDWHAAYSRLLCDKEKDDDGLPDIGLAFNPHALSAISATSSMASTSAPVADNDEDLSDGVDEHLQIPGELVLAKERAEAKEFWPARILEYFPKSEYKRPGKKRATYKIEYMDKREKTVTRTWFHTSDEDEFGTCILGQFQSLVVDEAESDDGADANGLGCEDCAKDSFDIPQIPWGDYASLSTHRQFCHTIPVLTAVLTGQYGPATTRHEDFIAGGKRREKLSQEAGCRGDMDVRDVNQVHNCLKRWCLGIDRIPMQTADLEDDNSLALPQPRRSVSPDIRTEVTSSPPPELPPPSSLPQIEVNTLQSTPARHTREWSPTSPLTPLGEHDLQEVTAIARSPMQGCPAYQRLSPLAKIEYCMNMLLPVAIGQILLWRARQRTSTGILSAEEEERLYSKGEELRRQTDWVFDVMRMRKLKERLMQKPGKAKTR